MERIQVSESMPGMDFKLQMPFSFYAAIITVIDSVNCNPLYRENASIVQTVLDGHGQDLTPPQHTLVTFLTKYLTLTN